MLVQFPTYQNSSSLRAWASGPPGGQHDGALLDTAVGTPASHGECRPRGEQSPFRLRVTAVVGSLSQPISIRAVSSRSRRPGAPQHGRNARGTGITFRDRGNTVREMDNTMFGNARGAAMAPGGHRQRCHRERRRLTSGMPQRVRRDGMGNPCTIYIPLFAGSLRWVAEPNIEETAGMVVSAPASMSVPLYLADRHAGVLRESGVPDPDRLRARTASAGPPSAQTAAVAHAGVPIRGRGPPRRLPPRPAPSWLG
jgi:hypothetical protein